MAPGGGPAGTSFKGNSERHDCLCKNGGTRTGKEIIINIFQREGGGRRRGRRMEHSNRGGASSALDDDGYVQDQTARCQRPSPRGGTCKSVIEGGAAAGSLFCSNHGCPVDGCRASKSSSAAGCPAHVGGGEGGGAKSCRPTLRHYDAVPTPQDQHATIYSVPLEEGAAAIYVTQDEMGGRPTSARAPSQHYQPLPDNEESEMVTMNLPSAHPSDIATGAIVEIHGPEEVMITSSVPDCDQVPTGHSNVSKERKGIGSRKSRKPSVYDGFGGLAETGAAAESSL